MKILIADDESLARATLRSMLQDLPFALEVLEDATNGEELIELVKCHVPDMVFVDIKMPKLNGLEAIKAGKLFAPDARWFILSGFPEFNYAQEALRMGVADYFLKPVDPRDLVRVVAEVGSEQKRRLLLVNKRFEHELANLFHGLNAPGQQESGGIFKSGNFIGMFFAIDSFLAESEKAEQQRALFQQMQSLVESFLAPEIKIALLALPSGEFVLIGAWEAEDDLPGARLCQKALRQVEQLIPARSRPDFCITLLQSAVCASYRDLAAQLHWLQKHALLRVFAGMGRKVHFKDLAGYEKAPEKLAISRLLGEISLYYREKTYVRYMSGVEDLMRLLVESQEPDYGTKRAIARFLGYACSCQLAPEQELDEWRQHLQASGEQILQAWPRKESEDVFEQALHFIEQHYQSDISIVQIAEKLRVTPNYLSTLFHKRTGQTFMKYLTRLRMLKARELLANPGMQVQQVAEQVGYYSTRHFTRVFTTYFGYYPSEQRKK